MLTRPRALWPPRYCLSYSDDKKLDEAVAYRVEYYKDKDNHTAMELGRAGKWNQSRTAIYLLKHLVGGFYSTTVRAPIPIVDALYCRPLQGQRGGRWRVLCLHPAALPRPKRFVNVFLLAVAVTTLLMWRIYRKAVPPSSGRGRGSIPISTSW